MKQVKFRSVLLLLLIVLLGLGLALFCLRYTFRGEAWASFSANGHAYTDGVVRTGQVLDPTAPSSMTAPPASITRTAPCGRPPSTPWEISWGTSPPRHWRRSSPGSSALTPSPAPSPAVTRCISP